MIDNNDANEADNEQVEAEEAEEEVEIQLEGEETNEQEETEQADDHEGEEESDSDVDAAEEPPRNAPRWVRDLRQREKEKTKQLREKERELAALRAKLSASQPAEKTPTLPKKPSPEDHDYDADAYADALDKWYSEKATFDAHQAKEKAKSQKVAESYESKRKAYADRIAALGVADWQARETDVASVLTGPQQALLIDTAEKPELVVMALADRPEELERLSSMTNVAQFAAAIARLESKVKIVKRKKQIPPEEVVAGGAPGVRGAADNTLARLRAEAEKTGDYSAVTAYRRKQQTKRK